MSSSFISATVQATSLTSLSSEESQLSVPPPLSTSILIGSLSSQSTGSAPAAIPATTETTASLSVQSVQGFSSTIDSPIATEPLLSLASPTPIGPTISPGSILPVSVSDKASSSSFIQPSGISSLPLEQSSSALASKGRVANAPLPTSSGISSFTLEPSTSSVFVSTGSHELQLQSVAQSGSSIESFPVSSAAISTLSSSIEQPTSSALASTVSHELQSPSVAQSLSSIQSSRLSSVAVSTPILTSKDRGAPLPTTSVIASPSLEQATSSVLASTVSHEVQSQSAVRSVSSVQFSQLSSVAASTPVLISKGRGANSPLPTDSAISSHPLEQATSSVFTSTIQHESQSVAQSLSSVQSLQISSAAVSTPPPRSVARVGNALPPTGEAEVAQSSEAVVLSSTIASSHTGVTASSAAPSASDSASAPALKTSHDVPDVPSSIPSSGSSSGSAIVSSSAPPKSSVSFSVPPSVFSSEHVLPPSRPAALPSAAPSTVQVGSPSGQPVLSQKSAQISQSETDVRSPSTTQATASQAVAQHAQANAKTPTATSTITDRPETTLSKPVFVSTTNSLGHSTVTIPPLITSLAVSTEADGSLVTVTHVVANPTGIWGIDDTADTKHGFFANTGAVAGVFLVVGVIVASIVAIVGIILCKRRRRQRIRLSISRPIPYPENPFEDPRDSPSPTQMRYTSNSVARNVVGTGLGAVPVTYDLTNTSGVAPSPPPRTYTIDRLLDEEAPIESQVETSMAGIGAGRTSLGQSVYDGLMYNGPFSDYHNFRPTHYSHPSDASGPIGLAITMEDPAEVPAVASYSRPRSRPVSPAPSTPSVYPATLPADDEVELERGNEPLPTPAASDDSHVTPVPHSQRRAPEIPPRNPLRSTDLHSKLLIRTQLTPQEGREPNAKPYEPLTPPASISSEQSQSPRSTLVNPFSEVQLEMPQTPSNANPYDNFYTRRKLAGPELHTRTSIEWRR